MTLHLNRIIAEFENNLAFFNKHLSGNSQEMITWRPHEEHWCLLEIVCHLLDEEQEDFRARVKSVRNDPNEPLTPIDPQGWVMSRNYMAQDYETKVSELLIEKGNSIQWLTSLSGQNWDNTFKHPKLGDLSAYRFLCNWLCHDYLHMRQIIRLKRAYLQMESGFTLDYAGNW